MKQYTVIKSNKTGMVIILDNYVSFDKILEELSLKFDNNQDFWGNVHMTLSIEGRILTADNQIQIVNTITEHSDIDIICLLDSDYKEVQKSKQAFEKKYMELNNLAGEFITGSLRKGDIIKKESSLIIIGDVFEGATVESGGDIIVLGELAGCAKAGMLNNKDSVIISFLLNTDDLTIAGISLNNISKKYYKLGVPAAIMILNNQLFVKNIKKSFLSAINHKKCW